MSQQRMRKAAVATELPRTRSSVVKAAGDSNLPNPNRHQQPRSRSKNKIPKNLREDLDNALVGLCDVWFEEIKPHLIRNNIKVHIHGDDASPASGDHQQVPLGAPGCSHYDPGAASDHLRHQCVSYVDCYATPPTASKAPCRRPPAPPTSPLQLILQSLRVQSEYKSVMQHSRSQKSHLMQPHTHHSCEPSVAHTYSVFPSTHQRRRYRDMQSAVPSRKTRGTNPIPINVMVDKETQTNHIRRRSSSGVASKIPASSSPVFDRCPGKTTLFPSRLKVEPKVTKTLLNESLIIDDAVKSSPQFKILFFSPMTSKFNSSVTLLATPKGKRKGKDAGKKRPWR